MVLILLKLITVSYKQSGVCCYAWTFGGSALGVCRAVCSNEREVSQEESHSSGRAVEVYTTVTLLSTLQYLPAYKNLEFKNLLA